nr:9458_t:CDS:1 [Entrophospora candida]
MPNNHHISARERQRIRARLAEVRRLPLNEVPYHRSNIEFFQYLFEAGEVSQDQYNLLVFRHHYPVTEQAMDYARNRINNVNRILNRVPQEYRNIVAQGLMDNFIPYIHINRTRANPVTYESIIEHHGERLAETNNSLCKECLMPIVFGEELCEECQQEEQMIPQWMFE